MLSIRFSYVSENAARLFHAGKARCTRVRGTHAEPEDPGATEESHKAKANVPNVYNLGSSASELRTWLGLAYLKSFHVLLPALLEHL